MHPAITPQYIRQLLDYNPETGELVWKERKLRPGLERIDKGWNKRFAGKKVSDRFHRHGHSQIGIHCKNFMTHRVVWAHYYDVWPIHDLDHINGKPADNRIANLREATASENLCNAKIRVNNTSGVKGVSWSKSSNKWYSYITKNKKMMAIGLFDSFDEAVAARRQAEHKFHGSFARKT